MKDSLNLKINVYILLTIIPFSALGYYFASQKESLFFVYEWLLAAIIVISVIYALKNMVSIQSELKWVAISIFAFLIQFSLLSLFLGPLTYFSLIFLYYIVAMLAFVVFIITLRKNKSFRGIPIIFSVLTGFFTLYMIFIHMMWSNSF